MGGTTGKPWLSALCLAICAFSSCAADDQTPNKAIAGAAKAKVKVVGICVLLPSEERHRDLRPFFGADPGTHVALMIVYEPGGLIAVDEERSKLRSFTDQAGRELITKKTVGWLRTGLDSDVSKDRTAALVKISGNEVPNAESKTVKLTADLLLRTGTGEEAHIAKDVPLKEGAKLKAGSISFTVGKVGEPRLGDEPMQVILKAAESLERVIGIEVLDSEDKPIQTDSRQTSSIRDGDRVASEWTCRLSKEITKATVRVVYWKDVQELRVPVEMEVSLGLGGKVAPKE